MKKFQKLNTLPLGAIKAEGFLKDQLILGKDGISGNLYKLEPGMIADPYVRDAHVEGWSNEEQVGWQAEISGNYWAGYIQHAFVLGDEEMIARATKWVDDVLKTQLDNGYLGTFRFEGADIYDDYNPLNVCGYRGLIAFYEATKRQDVLDALHRALLWFCDNWAGDKKTCYAGHGIVQAMVPVYKLTGDTRLRDFAVEYMEYMATHDIFKKSYKAMLEEDIQYFADHAAGLAHCIAYPALVYTATGDEKYLNASVRRVKQAREKVVHITGGATCAAEYAAPICSNIDYEYCSFTFFVQSYHIMGYATGNPVYGDYMENVFYNAAQGARKKDEKAIAYLSAPNQIFATDRSSSYCSSHQVYAPCHKVACCPVNAVVILPEFIRNMLLCDDDNNIYAFAYGPCSLNYNGISITEKTYYPFRNNVQFEINCDKKFALNLKVPEWAKGYTVTLNGRELDLKAYGGYVKVENDFKTGDIVEITFKSEVEVIKVDDSDGSSKFPLAFKYGALIYSYHIPEKWEPCKGDSVTPLPEGWSFYGVYPKYEEADVPDFHERLGLRRHQFTWNVAVDENLSADDVEIEEIEPNGYVWENPMIKLHTHCYKALYLNAPYQGKTYEPFGAYQKVTEKLPLTLEPYGCTNLRITCFPKADLNGK